MASSFLERLTSLCCCGRKTPKELRAFSAIEGHFSLDGVKRQSEFPVVKAQSEALSAASASKALPPQG